VFYRTFALVNWWKLSHKDDPNPTPISQLHENDEFITRFKEVFKSKLIEIPKKLKLPKDTPIQYIIGKDCPRKDIWRMNLYSGYKGTREDYSNTDAEKTPNKLNPKPFFELVYKEDLFQTTGMRHPLTMLFNPSLEADDCLAIAAKRLLQNAPQNSQIYIITSDTDYIQLCQPRIHLVNLKFKPVNTEKNSFGNPQKDLLFKIILGDKSDNIPSVFKKCGKKTAEKYCNDISLFEQKLIADECIDQYKLNRRLIDFNEIPDFLQTDIKEQLFTNLGI
jgi:5'-3' exonuclease